MKFHQLNLWAPALLAPLFFLSPALHAQTEIRFLLIPKAEFQGAETDPAQFLPDGEIRLYRPGEYKPRLLVKPNEPTVLPAGPWLWIAEAPGWVTTEAGAMTLPNKPARLETRTVVGLLVPACGISLGEAKLWAGTERVDFVSLSHGVTYPLPLDFRRSLRVPTGRWLAYSVGPRGLIGITKPRSCAGGQELLLRTIGPPRDDREEWMVHVEIPADLKARPDSFLLSVQGALRGQPPLAPSASFWNGQRGTYFFHDVSAAGESRLVIRQPQLRTYEEGRLTKGGEAVEWTLAKLKPRRSLGLTVDYQPARPHREAWLQLVNCGPNRVSTADVFNPPCTERDVIRQQLRRGVASYTFPDLDDGQYRLDAKIDEDVLWGLGEGILPVLDPENDDSPLPLKATVRESHVAGQLLESGRPVPGYFQLLADPDSKLPDRMFPTDDELTFHLYYFGYEPVEWLLPKSVRAEVPKGTRLLSPDWNLSACSADGRCRMFNSLSKIVGEGRWEIDLGGTTSLEFQISDIEDGQPIPRATIATRRTAATYFVNGKELEYLHENNMMPDLAVADEVGHARLRWRRTGLAQYSISAPGYEGRVGDLEAIPGETLKIEVKLKREAEEERLDAPLVRLRHGEPLGRAFFLVFDAKGERQPCSRATTSAGRIAFPPDCLAGRKAIVIHPAAALQILDGEAISNVSEIALEPAPAKPAAVQVTDGEGRPISDIAFELRLPEISLTLNDFYFASSLSGQPLGLGRTNAEGTVYLPTVDPRVWGPVEAVVVLGESESAVEVELGKTVLLEVQ